MRTGRPSISAKASSGSPSLSQNSALLMWRACSNAMEEGPCRGTWDFVTPKLIDLKRELHASVETLGIVASGFAGKLTSAASSGASSCESLPGAEAYSVLNGSLFMAPSSHGHMDKGCPSEMIAVYRCLPQLAWIQKRSVKPAISCATGYERSGPFRARSWLPSSHRSIRWSCRHEWRPRRPDRSP